MIEFETDLSRSLFVIRYRGHVAPDQVEKSFDEIRRRLNDFQQDFRLLGDMTELETMDVGCAPFIEQMMDLFNAKGVSTIVRIIPDPHRDIGLAIMSIFHYRGDVRVVTCQSLAEADQILAAENAD